MIVVKIYMYPGGDKEKKYLLGAMSISNDGTGTVKVGDYDYAISHMTTFKTKKGVWKTGKVSKFPRRLSVYNLIQRCLADAGLT